MVEAAKELKRMQVCHGELESVENVEDAGVSVDGLWCHFGFEGSYLITYSKLLQLSPNGHCW